MLPPVRLLVDLLERFNRYLDRRERETLEVLKWGRSGCVGLVVWEGKSREAPPCPDAYFPPAF